MCMEFNQNKSMFIKLADIHLYKMLYKVLMAPFLHMDKPVLVKHLLWLAIIRIHNGKGSFHEVLIMLSKRFKYLKTANI